MRGGRPGGSGDPTLELCFGGGVAQLFGPEYIRDDRFRLI